MRSAMLVLGLVSLAACGESRDTRAEPAPESMGDVTGDVTGDMTAAVPEPESREPDEQAAGAPTETDTDAPPPVAPEGGCAVARTHDLGAGSWADVAPHGEGFLVASLTQRGDAEHWTLTEVNTEARVRATRPLDLAAGERRAAGPVLARRGEALMLAYVDGGSRLRVVLASARRPVPRTVAEGASLRFLPALGAAGEGWAVAWTNAHDTPMRVWSQALAPDGQARGDARDHTPLAGGAAAPTMVVGADPPRLLFLDPRQATSVSLGATWEGDGFAEAEVARPVGLVTEPPEIAAVHLGQDDWLAYTGIGSLATTAVGVVALGSTDDPSLLVPGTGYGTLHVDGDTLGAGAVWVADAPRARPPDAPRSLHVRRADAGGHLGDVLELPDAEGTADRGRIAAHSRGRVAVSYRSNGHIWLTELRCL